MTDKARELLERALFALESTAYFDKQPLDGKPLAEEIRAYLAEPEVKREALSEKEIFDEWQIRLNRFESNNLWTAFLNGVRFAEKHHGIGGGDE